MKVKKIWIIEIAAILLIIIAAGFGACFLDLFSYTATGSENLTPDGDVVGKALVVYDPGISGIVKSAAYGIASDLKSMNYEVTVAGIRSQEAAQVAGYDMVIVGSPTYAGNPASSVTGYLNSVQFPGDVAIGVFATGSSPEGDNPTDAELVMADILKNNSINVKAKMKLTSQDNMGQRCEDFAARMTA